MSDTLKITQDFWDALGDDRTVMLRRTDERDMPRPMTAQTDPDAGNGDIWFFGDLTDDFVATLRSGEAAAQFTFVAKGHDLFATVDGTLALIHDPQMVDRLWTPFVAAWYPGGKTDPKLALLRFHPGEATIWKGGSGILTGMKALLGLNVQDDFKDNVAHTRLG